VLGLVQALQFQVVVLSCSRPWARKRSSLCSLGALSTQNHWSILFELVAVVVDQNYVVVLACKVGVAVAAHHSQTFLVVVVLVLSVHWANHCDHRSLCSPVEVQAQAEHRQASHRRHWYIVHACQAVSDSVTLAAGNPAEVEQLAHCLLGKSLAWV